MMNIESGAVLPGKKDRTMITKESPIGVIDSGIGGFSVARKVQKLMPHENLLYLATGPIRLTATTARRRSSP